MKMLDLSIMIAATACGLALYRIHESIIESGQWSGSYIVDVAPLFVMWTVAFAILRLRKPRPRLRRLFRQSGMAACSTSLIVLTVFLALRLLGLMQIGGEFLGAGPDYWFPTAFREILPWVGSSVAAVWLNLVLSGRWIAEPSWIDRLGRLLAAYWIGVAILYVVYD